MCKHRSGSKGRARKTTQRDDMSDKLTPDNVLIEDGGETYEDLVGLSGDDDE
jgi:hypothetical protein